MNIPAMHQLIRVLKAAPPEHFDMADVARLGQPLDRSQTLTTADLHTCGSAACVIGYAAADPWFQQRGLILNCCGGTYAVVSEYKAAEILGLSDAEIDLIFVAEHPLVRDLPFSSLTPAHMIEVVEAMITNHLLGLPLDGSEE